MSARTYVFRMPERSDEKARERVSDSPYMAHSLVNSIALERLYIGEVYAHSSEVRLECLGL